VNFSHIRNFEILGHDRGSVEHSNGKSGKSVVVILRFLCSSLRLCQLRTKGLVPLSKYWAYRSRAGDMGPVSLVSYHQQMLGLRLLIRWLCWERNWGGSHGPLSWAERWSREHFFSGAVVSNQCCWRLAKGCYMRATWDTYGRRSYVNWVWKAGGMLVGFSPIWCTAIQITVTLGYE
jgi:hypothetical protein